MKLLIKLYRLLFPVKQLVWVSCDIHIRCYFEIWLVNNNYRLKIGGHCPKTNSLYPKAVEKLNEFNNNK